MYVPGAPLRAFKKVKEHGGTQRMNTEVHGGF